MTRKLKLSFAFVVPIALGAISMSVAMAAAKNIHAAKADPTSYEITLDSNNAPAALTSTFQKTVSATFTTARNSQIAFNLTNAKALEGGYAKLGNYGSVYCITNDDHHLSGVTSVKVTYTGGQLDLYSSGVASNHTDGNSFITLETSLTSGTAFNFTNPSNGFVLRALEAEVDIEEIKLTYSCSESDQAYTFNQTYYLDDFEGYSATGKGYDGNNGIGVSTGLRSQYYSTYNGSGTNPKNGSGWQIMGSTDYLTLINDSSKAHGGNKVALMKGGNGNYFSYIQAKHYFGIPVAMGIGNKLSVWMKGAYSATSMATQGTVDAQVSIIAYYNRALNTAGVNDCAVATYTVKAGTPWAEYTLDLDSSRTVFGYGIHIAKTASGTVYVPVDYVRIYGSVNPSVNNWPVGNYVANLSVAGYSIPTMFAFSDVRQAVAVKLANTNDAGVTGYTYNTSTHQFTITTDGSYNSMTYGTITGTWDKANNRLTNVGLDGSISSYVSNNGSITVPIASAYLNCDGDNTKLQSIFKRRYSGTVDTGNADRLIAATWNANSGTNSMRVRLHPDYLTQVNLQNDIDLSCSNVGFWVYSSATEDKTIRMWTYTGAGLTNNAEIGSVTAKAGQWTFVCMGFNTKPLQLKNFQIAFDKWSSSIEVLIDDVCLY